MALPKLYDRVYWDNNTTPAINEDNLNSLSKAVDDIDDRVIALAGTIMEDVPQIQEDIEELEEDFELIDGKIAEATSEANRATTKANEAAASVISAENKALVSEGYAKGTQNGTPVGSSSPYYHNNAEYFKEQARSFTPEGYQDLVDDVQEAQEAITDIEGQTVSSNDAYVLRQSKGNMVDLGLVGGSIAWNQLIQNGNFDSADGWSGGSGTLTVSNNVAKLTFTGSSWNNEISRSDGKLVANHKYLASFDFFASSSAPTDYSFNHPGTPQMDMFTFKKSEQKRNISRIFIPSADVTGKIRIVCAVNASSYSGAYFEVSNFILSDLTQLFGSTIADYIYALEQATAEAGVAWFRQYFRNLYYEYDPGSIKSVNPKSRKVTGKNLFRIDSHTATGSDGNGLTWTDNGDGSFSVSGTPTGFKAFDFIMNGTLPVGDYIVNGGFVNPVNLVFNSGYLRKGSDNVRSLNVSGTSNVSFSILPTDDYDNIIINFKRNANSVATSGSIRPMIYFATVTDTTYEPYQEVIYPFDTSKQLRGIFKLDANNKLYADGDVYTADGSITRKYGIVNLGSLTWGTIATSTSGYSRFIATLSDLKLASNNDDIVNMISSKYLAGSATDTYNRVTCVSSRSDNHTVMIYDDNYATGTADAFKTAMDGVYLVYELATPTTESANAYQNPQRAFIDGTEGFVYDSGIAVPVGNNSKYYPSEALPSSQDYTDGAVKGKVDWDSNAVLGAHNLWDDVTLYADINNNASGSATYNSANHEYTISTAAQDYSGVSFKQVNLRAFFANFAGKAGKIICECKADSAISARILTNDVNKSLTTDYQTFTMDVADFASISAVAFFTRTYDTTHTIYVKNIRAILAEDANTDFAPFTMTNQQLTERVGPIEIPASSDLNNYKNMGVYSSLNAANSATLSNTPVTDSGFVLETKIIAGGSVSIQLLYPNKANCPIYMRKYYGSWSSWFMFTGTEVT